MTTKTKIIIVIVIVALIGAAIGFYYWNKKKNTDKKVAVNTGDSLPPEHATPGGALPNPTRIVVMEPLKADPEMIAAPEQRER